MTIHLVLQVHQKDAGDIAPRGAFTKRDLAFERFRELMNEADLDYGWWETGGEFRTHKGKPGVFGFEVLEVELEDLQ